MGNLLPNEMRNYKGERHVPSVCQSPDSSCGWPSYCSKQYLWSSQTALWGPQWSNSRKGRFLIIMSQSLNRKFLHLSIFKTIYLMTQLQNIGDFGCVVCHLVCPLVSASEKFFSFSKRYWGKDDYTFNLLTCIYLNHTYYKLRLC